MADVLLARSPLPLDELAGVGAATAGQVVKADGAGAAAWGDLAAPAPQPWDFPFTYEPSALLYSSAAIPAANYALHWRCQGKSKTISSIGLEVVASSGNISVAVTRSAAGRASPTTRVATSGAVACPAVGYAEVPLTASVAVEVGTDWFALSCDNTTATFRGASATTANNNLYLGFQASQSASHPIPASPTPTGGVSRSWILIGV